MELIVEVIMWFIIEVVFWGIMFWTGYLLVSFITFGHWPPKKLGNSKSKIKENRKKPEFLVTAIIGAIFWISVGIGLTVIIKNN